MRLLGDARVLLGDARVLLGDARVLLGDARVLAGRCYSYCCSLIFSLLLADIYVAARGY